MPPYAQPTPAPPSSGPIGREPPRAVPGASRSPASSSLKQGPEVSELGSHYDVYALANRPAGPSGARYAAGFWNLTAADLSLRVDGKEFQIPRGKNHQVGVGKQFVWQVDGRPARTENIAAGEAGLEIVIRR